jgi:DNA adenine methylase
VKSFIPWVGGKGKLLWLINTLAPVHYGRFIDVFGGSGTVTMNRPIQPGCLEVYNDFNSNLTNLFCCVKNRTMALLDELGFLPFHSRDDFSVLYKFFSRTEFTDDYLEEELELTQKYLPPPEAGAIRQLMLERTPRGDLRRAADYFKLVRYSFSGGAKSFAGKPCDLRGFFYLIWECSRRLADTVVENKDFEELINQYDREDAFFYCDPPYFEAEDCYEVGFPEKDHQRLHDRLTQVEGFVMVSYNYCSYICDLYQDFYIFYTKRPNSMSQTAGSEYEEVVMTNYDPRVHQAGRDWQLTMFGTADPDEDAGRYQLIHEPIQKEEST